jgi:hypothetical protein
MAYKGPYNCTECGQDPGRENITVITVQFKPIGSGVKVLKSRTIGWLCPGCLLKNPTWNLEYRDAPAYKL